MDTQVRLRKVCFAAMLPVVILLVASSITTQEPQALTTRRAARSVSAFTPRPTSRAAAAPCWTSAPSSGHPTAGPSPAITQPQRPALTAP